MLPTITQLALLKQVYLSLSAKDSMLDSEGKGRE